ncbi:chemotaxis protein MotB [Thermanaeromonas toyohensis ToBE]|uniref:Chemotaxis protein MotB n=1 Tax=Thermanaeromonas toyohensis ToBE TaxID=698762 RepID=A0A1W1VT85_9FIRM|nr:OmpA family protein [Thermanaeromonas toyohensis]SMB96595.1 chemotaxis protein MotB [Thermanaeromonas toyohensis ToBE]
MKRWRDGGKEEGLDFIRPSPHWLVTYADMITLLLCAFALFFAMSTFSETRFYAARESVARTFGMEVAPRAVENPVPQVQWDLPQLESVEESLRQYLEEHGIPADMVRQERGLVVRFSEVALFDRGSADLRPEGRRSLSALADFLVGVPNHVRVEGHTCDLPIHNARYQSNWELSTARATAALHVLEEKIPQWRLSAAGYGEFRPVAPNDSEANRARNRRVDVVILRLSLTGAEPETRQ